MFTPVVLLPLLFSDQSPRLGTQPCTGERQGCYSSHVVLADLDGDGDLDIVFASGGGYYVPDEADPIAVYLNDGKAEFQEIGASAFGGFTGRLRQVAVGDIDGDGDNDVIAPDSWAMQADAVFVNQGGAPLAFVDEGATRLGTSSRAAAARLADLDGDGDLDLLLTDWGAAPPASPGTGHVYLNDGSGHFAELVGAVPSDTANIGTGPIDADVLDADGDFDLDLVLASREGESLYFVNDGSGHFAGAQDRLPDQPGPYVYGPDSCDVNGDDALDLWLDNGGTDSGEQLLLNDRSGTFRDVTATHVIGDPLADDNEVQCVDLDDDGDLDAIVASLSNEERLLTNDGAGTFTTETGVFPASGDATLGLDVGDLDGDGRLDAVTAQGELPPFLNKVYLGTVDQAVDDTAPRLRAVERDLLVRDGKARVRFAVVDRATSDVGPRLREAWVDVEGARTRAHFVGGDLFFAAVDAAGMLRYQACATDAAGNSACSAVVTFTPPMPPDAGTPSSDAGTPSSDDEDGCGCRAGGAGEGATWLILLGLPIWRWRRGLARSAAAARRGGPRSPAQRCQAEPAAVATRSTLDPRRVPPPCIGASPRA